MDNDELVADLRYCARIHEGRVRHECISAAADEIERLTGIVLCLTRRWPDCNAKDCGQPCMPKQVIA